MNTIGYTRVSTDRQAINGHSLAAQSNAVRDYCSLYGLDLTEVIEDAGVSAKSINGRPGMTRLLGLIADKEIAAVVIYKLDRAFRSIRDALGFFETCAESDVAVHSVMEKLDTSSATGRFTLHILVALSQLEREQTAERTTAVLAHLKSRAGGRPINGRAPYGYQWIDGTLRKQDREQEIIQTMNDWSAAGLNITAITQRLNSTPDHHPRAGSGWHRTQVSRIVNRGF